MGIQSGTKLRKKADSKESVFKNLHLSVPQKDTISSK